MPNLRIAPPFHACIFVLAAVSGQSGDAAGPVAGCVVGESAACRPIEPHMKNPAINTAILFPFIRFLS